MLGQPARDQVIAGDGLLRGRSCIWTGPDEARCQLILDCALPVRPPGWDSLECRVRAVLWHVMNGNKVGKYGDFHMLPSTVRYDRTHPVQLTASNLALPLKMTPEKKRDRRRRRLQRPRQLTKTRELVRIGQAGTSRAREGKKSFGSGWLRTPPFLGGRLVVAMLLWYSNTAHDTVHLTSTWLGESWDIERERKAVRESARLLRHFSACSGRGQWGRKAWGRARALEIQARQLNTTQRSATDHGTARSTTRRKLTLKVSTHQVYRP